MDKVKRTPSTSTKRDPTGTTTGSGGKTLPCGCRQYARVTIVMGSDGTQLGRQVDGFVLHDCET